MFLSRSRMKLIHVLLWKFWKIQNDYTEENNTVLNFFFFKMVVLYWHKENGHRDRFLVRIPV